MPILTPKSELQNDLDAKDLRIVQCAAAAHNLAVVMGDVHRWLWTLPDDRLLAVLNDDIQTTQETLTQNATLGAAVNAALDAMALPMFPTRAPVTIGRADVVFDVDHFVIVPPPPSDPPVLLPPPV